MPLQMRLRARAKKSMSRNGAWGRGTEALPRQPSPQPPSTGNLGVSSFRLAPKWDFGLPLYVPNPSYTNSKRPASRRDAFPGSSLWASAPAGAPRRCPRLPAACSHARHRLGGGVGIKPSTKPHRRCRLSKSSLGVIPKPNSYDPYPPPRVPSACWIPGDVEHGTKQLGAGCNPAQTRGRENVMAEMVGPTQNGCWQLGFKFGR